MISRNHLSNPQLFQAYNSWDSEARKRLFTIRFIGSTKSVDNSGSCSYMDFCIDIPKVKDIYEQAKNSLKKQVIFQRLEAHQIILSKRSSKNKTHRVLVSILSAAIIGLCISGSVLLAGSGLWILAPIIGGTIITLFGLLLYLKLNRDKRKINDQSENLRTYIDEIINLNYFLTYMDKNSIDVEINYYLDKNQQTLKKLKECKEMEAILFGLHKLVESLKKSLRDDIKKEILSAIPEEDKNEDLNDDIFLPDSICYDYFIILGKGIAKKTRE